MGNTPAHLAVDISHRGHDCRQSTGSRTAQLISEEEVTHSGTNVDQWEMADKIIDTFILPPVSPCPPQNAQEMQKLIWLLKDVL